MIRPLNPTYLPILLSLKSRLSPNEAHTRNSLGALEITSSSSMRAFLKQWVSPRLKHKQCCWVWTSGIGIQGLISMRRHHESSTWEINHLLLARDGSEDTCYDFLSMLGNYGKELEITRILLRLSTDSSLVEVAQHAGFSTYLSEHLYQVSNGARVYATAEKPLRYTVRPCEISDEYHIFEIYNLTFPTPVRAIEGMTFKEWQEVRGKLSCQQWKRQFICESEGSLAAQFRLATEQKVGQFEAMIRPEEDHDEILNHIMSHLQDYHYIRCLVPECHRTLAMTLERYGFEPLASYSTLVRSFTVPVKEPSLVPINV